MVHIVSDCCTLLHQLKRFEFRQYIFIRHSLNIISANLFAFVIYNVGKFKRKRMAFDVGAIVEPHSQSIISCHI